MIFFLLNSPSKFIDICRMDTVLLLILLDSEMLKIPRAKVEAPFPKKLDFVTKKSFAQDAFGKYPRISEKLSETSNTSYTFSYFLVCSTSNPSKWVISVTNMHCLSVCEASGSGRVDLKKQLTPSHAVLWIVNVRERKPRYKKKVP